MQSFMVNSLRTSASDSILTSGMGWQLLGYFYKPGKA